MGSGKGAARSRFAWLTYRFAFTLLPQMKSRRHVAGIASAIPKQQRPFWPTLTPPCWQYAKRLTAGHESTSNIAAISCAAFPSALSTSPLQRQLGSSLLPTTDGAQVTGLPDDGFAL